MDPRWKQIEEVFGAAADLPPAERAAYLDQACREDAELRAEVESLLAAGDSGYSRFGSAIGDFAATVAEGGPSMPQGRTVGAYEILSEIGRGGMGAVYLAQRADRQFRKKVALKVARFSPLGDPFAIERFRHERQILASLEHPHIARLLDGGETEEGLPYLVMEYIEGSNILDYANAARLDTNARLGLFLKVAGAVQYAHQALVIHRDLKPANILVTQAGEPKLLDFGISKLLEPGPDQTRVHTSTGMRLLTPDYASPEQVRGQAVTTATDIYSLGAVLFELLTGRKAQILKDYTAIEIDQVVCEKPVERPSATAPLLKLSPDLDVIVLKAMHKEPARRYASVEHLADDVRRYLDGLPIQARGDSAGYRARVFVKRHRVAVTAALFVALSLVAGIAATAWQAREARRQADQAQLRFRQVRQLANRFLFEFDEQVRKLEGSTPAREMIIRTAQEYLDSLSRDADQDPQLRQELAAAYLKLAEVQGAPTGASLGHSEDALRSYRRSRDLGRGLFDAGVRDIRLIETLIEAERGLGLLEHRLQPVTGDNVYHRRLRDCVQLAETLVAQDRTVAHVRLLASLYREVGSGMADNDRASEAQQAYLKALPLFEEVRAREPGLQAERGVLILQERLGDAAVMRGDVDGGRARYEKAVEGWRRVVTLTGAGQRERRSLMGVLLSLGLPLGDPHYPNLRLHDAAIRVTEEALAIAARVSQADPRNLTAKLDLAYAEAQLGRCLRPRNPTAAIEHLRRAVRAAGEVEAASPKDLVYRRHVLRYSADLGFALLAAGQTGAARKQLEALVARVAAMDKPSRSYRLIAAECQRELALLSRDPQLAGRALAVVEDYYRKRLDSIEIVNYLSRYYEVLARVSPPAEAAAWKQKALQLWLDWPSKGATSVFDQWRRKEVEALL
jgi:eukaryotic-like serine/threonine-protein kinase